MTEDQVTGPVVGLLPGGSTPLLGRSNISDGPRLTTWLKLLLYCWVAFKIFAFASRWSLVHFFVNIQQGAYSSRSAAVQDAALLDSVSRIIGFGGLVVYVLTLILFFWWIRRANVNARRLGAVDMQFTPGWAIGWFFVPVANLTMPYHVMKEIWNASASPADWRLMPGHFIVRSWWGLLLVCSFIGYVAVVGSASSRGNLIASIFWGKVLMIADASAIAYGIAALLLVTRLRALQMASALSR
jgi:hypothetical protein